MIRCAHPEVLLLVPLLVLLLRGRLWPRAFVGVLRVLLLTGLAAVLAQVVWLAVDDGRDVVLVLDRSASMPSEARTRAQELATAIAEAQPTGDRTGLVTFGRKPVVESLPQAPFHWPATERAVDGDASDLAAAIDAALALLPPGRRGSLLVLSDGEANSGDLGPALRAAVRQGIRIDTQLLSRPAGADTAVADVLAPSSVPVGEPLTISAVVAAGAAGNASWRLWLDGAPVRDGEATLVAGRNVLQFSAVLADAGLHEFAVEVRAAGDRRPENDRAVAIVRATGVRAVLVVTPGGREDALTRALRAAGFTLVVAAPATAPLTPAGLDTFRAVVLEDVAANSLPAGAMQALVHQVKDLGCGLLMTGGKSSFGVGGYHRSPLEDVLPVTMEIREPQRRFGLAMAIALDCSGSMQATAGTDTKMQLANRGAGSAIELLAPTDGVAVLAVDTRAHVVVPMQAVQAPDELAGKARSIGVGGGGIYVGAALHAAAEQLRGAPQQQKHIVLFADASDSKEPDDFRTFVPELVRLGITVSVIGLGSASDGDAKLLQEIASLGGGRCQFVDDANDLPRVFAQETIEVARSSVIEAPTTIGVRAGLASLGDMPTGMPVVGGYAMAWLRPRAELSLATIDDLQAPFLSQWHIGLGRAAALLGEADGGLSGGLLTWPHYGDFFATLVRWLAGGQPAGLFVDAWRERGTGVFTLEVEPERAAVLDGVRGVLLAPDGGAGELVFERAQPGRLEARVPLLRTGTWRAAVQVAGETVSLPPLCLPYSPEHTVEVDARAGERLLQRLAQATGGSFEPSVAAIVGGERRSTGAIDLGPWLVIAVVVLLLAEIAVRRLRLFERAATAGGTLGEVVAVATKPAVAAPVAEDAAAGSAVLGALDRARKRRGLR